MTTSAGAVELRWALRAEWTKLRTLPFTLWTVLGVLVLTGAVSLLAINGLDPASCQAGSGCDLDVVPTVLAGVYIGQALVVVLAVLAVTNEYDTGMIRTTLAALPRRGTVLAAKATVATAVALAVTLLTTLGCLVGARAVLPGHGFTAAAGYPPLSLADEPTRRAFLGTVLYYGLVALLGLGLGVLLRHTGGTIAAALALLYVVPIVAAAVTAKHWHDWLSRLGPTTAGLAIQVTKRLADQPIGPWAGLGVLAGYAAAAVLAGAVLLRRRDA